MDVRIFKLYEDMLRQPHLLVAGATGSGKSVVVNGIIFNGLCEGPDDFQMILIDPKRVELVMYRDLPHTIAYASEPDDMLAALRKAMEIVETRYTIMQDMRKRRWPGGNVYVIIDELADLMTTQKKQVLPLLQRLCQIGRAANVHVIACTQCPIAKILPTEIRVNFDSRVGLRTRSAQDSRNILGTTGCEELPRYGQGYYMTPEGLDLYKIPMYEDSEIDFLVSYWTARKTA